MRIALVTLFTPTRYNYNAPSALLYQLIKYRHGGDEVKVFSFNYNDVPSEIIKQQEADLGISIELVSMPCLINKVRKSIFKYYDVFTSYHHRAHIKLNEADIERIKNYGPDVVWVYTEEIPQVVKQLSLYKLVVSCPDSIAMVYKRMAEVHPNNIKFKLRFRQFRNMEKKFLSGDSVMYHLVGEADRDFLKDLNPHINAVYLPHPKNKTAETENVFSKTGRIKLLISGRNDVYVRQGVRELLDGVFVSGTGFESYYDITFLGNGWDEVVEKIRREGYSVENKSFVKNYEEELLKYDVQLVPISVGSGTKGKVLDALCNGLLVIGTEYALENIHVQNGISAVKYADAEYLKQVLSDIPENRQRYKEIAKRGKKFVEIYHDSQKMANLFWERVKEL